MKKHGKVVLMIFVALMIAPAMAVAMAPKGPNAGGPPPAPVMGPPPMDKHPLADLQAFKDEMARRQQVVDGIMAPLKPIHEAMAAEIKALQEQYMPKPVEGEKLAPPEPEKMQEFLDKVRAIVEKYQTDNAALLKDIAGKMFDERILHQTNILKIEQDNKDAMVNASWKMFLNPPKFLRQLHEKIMKLRRMHPEAGPDGPPGPPPAPPEGAPGPSTVPGP
jgi:hypothetical protein